MFPFPRRLAPAILIALTVPILFLGCSDSRPEAYDATPSSIEKSSEIFPVTHDAARLAKIGPEACVECHAEEVAEWKSSHHAKANRPISMERDAGAFTPARRIKESGVTYELALKGTEFELHVVDDDKPSLTYKLVGVIGETPLRQYLAVLPGNKFQTISATYDVFNDKWVDVFAGQDRVPGEWGHWTGQGMNWNSNCAYCHTTEYQKGFDFDANTYHSTWVQQGLACAECHSNLESHVKEAAKDNYISTIPAQSTEQVEANCATCHSRRDQLTADAFKIGDNYHDHFGLSLPDQPGLYHADGQILDEVFVYGSFEMSNMGHAGVSCMDCHNPHTLEHILPFENNMLCMRCHEAGGTMNAPIIKPVEHSFHKEGSTGNQCVECHMPKTTYMQVDPRADHGFHSPDPLMTKELGIPNACSNCHNDQSLDWAVEHAETWYGDRLEHSRQRARARALTAAYTLQPEGMNALLELAAEEIIPAWQATYSGLLANYLPNVKVVEHLKSLADHESPLVRARVVSALAMLPEIDRTVIDKLSDPTLSVRMNAARSVSSRNQPISNQQTLDEWNTYQEFNSDRPQSLLMQASKAASENRPADVQKFIARALLMDSKNPEMYHQGAILLSSAGLNDAATRYLNTGWEMASDNVMFPYSLGLLAAESNDLNKAVGYLEEAVAMQPQFYRAWYNLSLAYQKLNRPEDTARAQLKAQGQ
ncbi:MAG: multiheme c-type cytochrome [Lentimonas sp.]